MVRANNSDGWTSRLFLIVDRRASILYEKRVASFETLERHSTFIRLRLRSLFRSRVIANIIVFIVGDTRLCFTHRLELIGVFTQCFQFVLTDKFDCLFILKSRIPEIGHRDGLMKIGNTVAAAGRSCHSSSSYHLRPSSMILAISAVILARGVYSPVRS